MVYWLHRDGQAEPSWVMAQLLSCATRFIFCRMALPRRCFEFPGYGRGVAVIILGSRYWSRCSFGVGREVNGAPLISLGIATFQPSELMKLVVVLYAADYTVRKAAFMDDVRKGFLPMFSVMTFIAALLLREPDFGALVVVTTIAMAVLFLGGLNWRLFAGLAVLLAGAFAALIVSSPYRLQRILGFMDPWSDSMGKGYQLSHSLIAFGRGELFGVGLGASVEKLFYLPRRTRISCWP